MVPTDTTHVRIREVDKRRIDSVAQARGWKRVKALEKAADALLQKEGVSAPAAVKEVPAGQGVRKKPRRSAA